MLREPIAGETRNSLKRAQFFEKMRRAGNDLQFHMEAHLSHRILFISMTTSSAPPTISSVGAFTFGCAPAAR